MKKIEVVHLTRDYGNGRGVFDLNLTVEPGEIYGFLGPNGAGKTTTIRHLMGFLKAKEGKVFIGGWDCFDKREEIQRWLGYLPGELSLMEEMSGLEFLKFQAGMRGMKDLGRMKELMEQFELNGAGKIRKMSKGMKQKIGIVCAFMDSPQVLLLDEPTSGLDPLMQQRFLSLLLEEKAKGGTILMSSHIFEEIERTCDRAAILKEGRLLAVEEVQKIRRRQKRQWEVRLESLEEAGTLAGQFGGRVEERQSSFWAILPVQGSPDELIKGLSRYRVEDIRVREQTLEEMFLHFYGGEKG